MKQSNEAAVQPGDKEQSRLQRLFGDQRFLLVLSLFLAVIVWVVFVVLNGEDQESVIDNVPVRVNYEGSIAERLDLKPFWSDMGTDLDKLTVSVTVMCPPYESITANDLVAELMINNVNSTGEYTLDIRVTPKRPQDRNRFTIDNDSVTPGAVSLYFARERALTFNLEPFVEGEILVPDGYYAGDILLSRLSVSIKGPASYVNAIAQVRAVIPAQGVLGETALLENIEIVPVDIYGDTPPFLTVEALEGGVSATVPVWKIATLRPVLDFSGVPLGYLNAPPRYSIAPASVEAALPEVVLEGLTPGGAYSVGIVSFRDIAPGHNTFTFLAEDLKEIVFLDDIRTFTAEVDMTGMDTVKLTLPGSAVKAAGPDDQTRFRDVADVIVVGPADVVKALHPGDLKGLAELPEEIAPGASCPVTITLEDYEDCWVYGEYQVRIR